MNQQQILNLIIATLPDNIVQAIEPQDVRNILNQIVNKMFDLFGLSSTNFAGAAEPADDPGTPSAGIMYFASGGDSGATYTHFLDEGGDAITLDAGEGAFLAYKPADGYWVKQTLNIQLSSYLAKSSVINDLSTSATDQPLAALQGRVLDGRIKSNTQYGTLTDIKGTLTSGKVLTQDGTESTNAAYSRTAFIAVTPGQVLIFTGYCVGAADQQSIMNGITGYASNTTGSFISDVDDSGKPIGAIFDNDRGNQYYDRSYPPSNQANSYASVKVTIPDGVYFIRASSQSAHDFKLETEIIDIYSPTVKDKISDVEGTVSGFAGQIDSLSDDVTAIGNKQSGYNEILDQQVKYGTLTDIKGDTTQVKVLTLNGSETANSAYNATDFIKVITGQAIYFTGYCAGAADQQSIMNGVVGYASNNAASFVSMPDGTGKPIGAIFDNDRGHQYYGVDYPPTNQAHSYANVKVIIPDGVNYIRVSSYSAYPFILQTEVVSVYDKSLKDKISDIEEEISDLEVTVDTQKLYRDRMAGLVRPYVRGAYPNGGNFSDRFTFIHCTDAHYFAYFGQQNLQEVVTFSKNSLLTDVMKCIVNTGDVCNGDAGRDKATTESEITAYVTDLLQSSLPVLNLNGNHDDNANMAEGGVDLSQALSPTEQYDMMFKPFADLYPSIITSRANTCNYYADFATDKIRFIALNDYDLPKTVDDNGQSIYPAADISGGYFSQDQIDWLYDTLNDTPSDYAVIVLTHGSLNEGYDTPGYLQGWAFIPSVIDAWKNGTSYTHSYTDPNGHTELDTSKVFDFTARGEGEFLCYLSGHVHTMDFVKNTIFDDQNHIIMACLKTAASPSGTGARGLTAGMLRGNNDEVRNSFGIISVDRHEKKLYVTVFGAHLDVLGKYTSRHHIISY